MTNQQQQVTGNPLDQLREAHEVFLEVLANVRPEQMSLPTPDDEWDVRALINHVVLGNIWAAENVKTGSALGRAATPSANASRWRPTPHRQTR